MKEYFRVSLDTDDTAVFHRTRFLNIMLEKVKTPITANYDIDVLLAPEDYKRAADAILLSGNSLVYPYRAGNSQRRILKRGRNKLYHNLLLTDIAQNEMKVYQSYCGHCQFFNTDDYRFGGMENEHFISFGPEDQERCMRFQKMGYKVLWMDNIVYHLEHRRTNNSSSWNPYFKNNNNLFTYLCSLNKEDIIRYYKSIEYLQKYN